MGTYSHGIKVRGEIMARMDVRTNIKIPVDILFGRNDIPPQRALTLNLGLNGAFINSETSIPEDTRIKLRADLPSYGEFVVDGRILRKEQAGVAVKFMNPDRNSKRLLWQYLKDKLPSEMTCPYCGHVNHIETGKCSRCGLTINFTSESFFDVHEEEIKERWTNYIDNATIELNESLASCEKKIDQGHADPEKTYSLIWGIIDKFLQKAEKFEHEVRDIGTIRERQVAFRLMTNKMFSKSYFVNRARIWPQGYQGDYKTLEGIYRNISLSTGIGYYFDLFFLSVPLAYAVRNRIKKLEVLLREELENRNSPSILNIACGSCRELVGLTEGIKNSNAKIICVDSDNDALAFAHHRLSYSRVDGNMEFRRYNVIRMFDHELNMMEFGKQDIVYSVGLFDYLPTDFLIKLFGALYSLLNPGGKIIAAFKDAARYRSQEYHWFVDWDGFQQRSEEDFRGILFKSGIPDTMISEVRDESGIIVFYIISR
jgi:SAM-dependent methyltransferase